MFTGIYTLRLVKQDCLGPCYLFDDNNMLARVTANKCSSHSQINGYGIPVS